MTYGTVISNLKIDGETVNYPVLNDRDTRAGAGIMLLFGITAFVSALLLKQYALLYATVLLFTIEFLIRVINPYKAPFYALGRLFVKNQKPDWSGAVQKRFAWSLGLLMAVSMIIIAIILQIRGITPFAICSVCLTLLWLESALGVCVGCKIYYGLMKKGLIAKPEVMPACPGGVCSIQRPNN